MINLAIAASIARCDNMKNYVIGYFLNNDFQRCFIEIEAPNEKLAIESLQRMGARILLNFKVASCRPDRRKAKRD